MIYRILADLLVALHMAFVLFVALGGILVLWRRRLAFVHIPAAIWGVLIEFAGWVCPLTPLEVRFRILGGEAGYVGGFMDQYLVPVLYPVGLTREQQVGLGILVAALNLGIYGVLVWKRKKIGTSGDTTRGSPEARG